MNLSLSAPTETIFLLALLLGGIGIASRFVIIPVLGPSRFWLLAAGYILLLAGVLFKGV